MSKELVISAASHERRVAILEEGQLVEIYIERKKNSRSSAAFTKEKSPRPPRHQSLRGHWARRRRLPVRQRVFETSRTTIRASHEQAANLRGITAPRE